MNHASFTERTGIYFSRELSKLRFSYGAGLFYVNVKQARVIRKGGTQLIKCSHQTSLWNCVLISDRCGRVKLTVGSGSEPSSWAADPGCYNKLS